MKKNEEKGGKGGKKNECEGLQPGKRWAKEARRKDRVKKRKQKKNPNKKNEKGGKE
jgi:hypothetical protein